MPGPRRPLDAYSASKLFLSGRLIGVDPGDDENRVSLADGPLNKGILGLKIENIELVDPGGYDQKESFAYFRSRRIILNELHQSRSGRRPCPEWSQYFRRSERIHIRHGNAEAALPRCRSLSKFVRPLNKFSPTVSIVFNNTSGLSKQSSRVPAHRRTASYRTDLPGCLLIEPLYASDGREDRASGKKTAVAACS